MSVDQPNHFIKDPDAILDYGVNWTEWIGDDRITISSWVVPPGIIKTDESFTDKIATVWLSSGTVNQEYRLINRVQTFDGRYDDRTIIILVKQK